jgi:hypothetical protein
VDVCSDHLFATAGLAMDEHRGIARSRARCDVTPEPLDRRAFADDWSGVAILDAIGDRAQSSLTESVIDRGGGQTSQHRREFEVGVRERRRATMIIEVEEPDRAVADVQRCADCSPVAGTNEDALAPLDHGGERRAADHELATAALVASAGTSAIDERDNDALACERVRGDLDNMLEHAVDIVER